MFHPAEYDIHARLKLEDLLREAEMTRRGGGAGSRRRASSLIDMARALVMLILGLQ